MEGERNMHLIKRKTNKWLLLIATIVSVLSIIPFVFFVKSMITMFGVMDFGAMPADEVAEILNRNIYSAAFFVPTFFIILSILINASISGYMLNHGVKGLEKSFAISNIVFGGLGFSLVFLIPSLLLKEHNYKEQKKYKYGFAAALIASVLSIFISFILSFSLKGFDKPTKVSTIAFSLNEKTPNIIEIFSDGFDPRGMGNQIDKENKANGKNSIYKEFYGIDKFITAGLLTNDSFPSLMTGAKENDYKLRKEQEKEKISGSLLDYTYIHKFAKGTINHMKITGGMNKYIINPIALTKSSLYNNQISGDVDYIKELDPSIKTVNWAQAKNENAGFMGTSRLSPDSQLYSWFNNHISGTKGDKPARIFMEDLVTHEPTVSTENGTIKWDSSYKHPTRKYIALNNHLKKLFLSFKKIKGNNTNVFDNSLIIIYGDHDDHSRKFKEDKYGIAGNRSFMLIKYPHETKSSYTKVTDRAVYAPFINKIIEEGIKQGANRYDFIKTNKNFKADRTFATWGGPDSMFLSKFSNDELVFNKDKNFLGNAYARLTNGDGYFKYSKEQAYLDAINTKVGWV